MKVILHIGMSKAGSSAIQQMLATNADALATLGYVFPALGRGRVPAHFPIFDALKSLQGVGPLAAAIRENASARGIIFSCEAFWLLPSPAIETLATALRDFSAEVILYLRSPWHYVPSSYRRAIKFRGVASSLATYTEEIKDRLDYPALVRRWSEYFPLKVSNYEQVKTRLGQHFCEQLELPPQALRVSPALVNTTPHDGAIRLMLWANRHLQQRLAQRLRPWLLRTAGCYRFLPKIDNTPAYATIAREIDL
jgi:hypothetical protein